MERKMKDPRSLTMNPFSTMLVFLLVVGKWNGASATPPILIPGSPVDTVSIMNERHNTAFERHHANKAYPKRVNTMLTHSSCRPDLNGYFGSVRPGGSGADATTIKYRFQLSVANMSDQKLDSILRIVEDSVMDAILAHAFPSVCAFQLDHKKNDNLNTDPSQITGLFFGDTELDPQESCQHDLTSTSRNGRDGSHAFCKVYMSSLTVFGRYTEASAETISAVIFQAVNHDSLTRGEKWGATHLLALGSSASVEKMDEKKDFFSADNSLFTLLLAISGFVILGACVSVWYLYFNRISDDQADWKEKQSMGDALTAASTSLGTQTLGKNPTKSSLVGTYIMGDHSTSYSISDCSRNRHHHHHHHQRKVPSSNSRTSRSSGRGHNQSQPKNRPDTKGSQRSSQKSKEVYASDRVLLSPTHHSCTSDISSVRMEQHGTVRKMQQRERVIVELPNHFLQEKDDDCSSSDDSSSQAASGYYFEDEYSSQPKSCSSSGRDYRHTLPAYLDPSGRYQETSSYY